MLAKIYEFISNRPSQILTTEPDDQLTEAEADAAIRSGSFYSNEYDSDRFPMTSSSPDRLPVTSYSPDRLPVTSSSDGGFLDDITGELIFPRSSTAA